MVEKSEEEKKKSNKWKIVGTVVIGITLTLVIAALSYALYLYYKETRTPPPSTLRTKRGPHRSRQPDKPILEKGLQQQGSVYRTIHTPDPFYQ